LSHCFIWGEPFGHAGLIERLADPLRVVNARWPEPHFIYRGHTTEALAEKFIANLYPPPKNLLAAYLAWFETCFAQPGRDAGKDRWGLKEVRLSADHASFLRWLYPAAKFLFLIRSPYAAFRSFAARRDQGWTWFHRWPTHPITPELFGRHWLELAASFRDCGEALGGLVLRYEDLGDGGWEKIRDYVGFELSEEAIRSNPRDGGPPPLAALAPSDLDSLRAAVEPLAEQLGYQAEAAARNSSPKIKIVSIEKKKKALEGQGRATESSSAPPKHALPEIQNTPQSASSATCAPSQCAILVPVADRIEPGCEASLRELERRGYPVFRVHGYKQIDLARCQMASDALAAGCEETLWIDADTAFHPDAVDQLRSHNLPIVCGIYPKKSKRELAIHAVPGTTDIQFGKGGGLLQIQYAPTGFLLVRREVYDSMREQLQLPECRADTGRTLVPYYAPHIRPDGDGWWYLAEDFAFCERARQCGYKIMADTTIRLFHIGTFSYGWEDAGRRIPRFASYKFHLSDAKEE
jgi:hypothetical protein